MGLSDIGNAIGGVLSGGLTGIIGVGVQRVFEYKSKQLDLQMQAAKLANDVAMKQADASIMAQEWAARTKVAQIEEQGKEATADAQAFSSALTSEPQRYSDASKASPTQEWLLIGLDVLRAIVRPGLTLYLCAITTVIYWQARELLGSNAMPIEQAAIMVNRIIETVLYLTTTCVMFYFGVRNRERPPKL